MGTLCISKADACKAVSQTDIPILIIHGDRDTQAPLSMAYRLYDSCSSENSCMWFMELIMQRTIEKIRKDMRT